jgi:putative transposase
MKAILIRPLSFRRYLFPVDVIRHADWLHFRFTFSIRDIEEMMAQRRFIVSREAIRLSDIVRPADRRQPSPSAGAAHRSEAFGRDGLQD